jgi:hypothetical protein
MFQFCLHLAVLIFASYTYPNAHSTLQEIIPSLTPLGLIFVLKLDEKKKKKLSSI